MRTNTQEIQLHWQYSKPFCKAYKWRWCYIPCLAKTVSYSGNSWPWSVLLKMAKSRRRFFNTFYFRMFFWLDVMFVLLNTTAFQRSLWNQECEILRFMWKYDWQVLRFVWFGAALAQDTVCSFVEVENTLNRGDEAGKEEAGFEWQESWLADVQVSMSLGWVFQFQAGGKEWVESACETEISAPGFTLRNLKQLSI